MIMDHEMDDVFIECEPLRDCHTCDSCDTHSQAVFSFPCPSCLI